MVLPGRNTCDITFLTVFSPGDSMQKGGWFGWEGMLVANPQESAGPL